MLYNVLERHGKHTANGRGKPPEMFVRSLFVCAVGLVTEDLFVASERKAIRISCDWILQGFDKVSILWFMSVSVAQYLLMGRYFVASCGLL